MSIVLLVRVKHFDSRYFSFFKLNVNCVHLSGAGDPSLWDPMVNLHHVGAHRGIIYLLQQKFTTFFSALLTSVSDPQIRFRDNGSGLKSSKFEFFFFLIFFCKRYKTHNDVFFVILSLLFTYIKQNK